MMIQNKNQYNVTRKHLQDFKNNLSYLRKCKNTPKSLKKIMCDSIKSQISVFEKQIKEYESTV